MERLNELNRSAYKAVLRALFANNTSNTETMKLMLKLRKELNVTSDEHKEWLQELIKARNEGTLGRLLQESLRHPDSQPGAMAANGWAAPQQQQPYQQSYQQPIQQPIHQPYQPTYQPAYQPAYQPTYQPAYQPAYQPSVAAEGSDDFSDAGGQGGSDSSFSREQLVQRRQGFAGTSYGADSRKRPSAADGLQASGSSRLPGSATKRPKAEPVNIPPLIGYKVQRYWLEDGWCEGIVTDYRERDGLYCITYNLGKKDESMEYFDIQRAEAIGNAQRSYYQQTNDKIDLRRYTSTRAYQNSAVLNPHKNRRRSSAKAG